MLPHLPRKTPDRLEASKKGKRAWQMDQCRELEAISELLGRAQYKDHPLKYLVFQGLARWLLLSRVDGRVNPTVLSKFSRSSKRWSTRRVVARTLTHCSVLGHTATRILRTARSAVRPPLRAKRSRRWNLSRKRLISGKKGSRRSQRHQQVIPRRGSISTLPSCLVVVKSRVYVLRNELQTMGKAPVRTVPAWRLLLAKRKPKATTRSRCFSMMRMW
mmetsp:Transcript_35912/g.64150  ORF Transcript_35912/g.64150 Transcript_35912/m.64150 type:complete len:217 (+) Transcript_35912:1697-2347(+)